MMKILLILLIGLKIIIFKKYKKDVCKVKEIRKNKMNNSDYYILVPIEDKSLIIDVPVDNKFGYIKDIMTKEEANELINKIPSIELISVSNDKYIEKEYKNLIYSGTKEDLIKIIKTTYLRNDKRIKNNRKKSERDDKYFNLAEKYLYNELSISLNMSFDDTKKFIINKVSQLSNKS